MKGQIADILEGDPGAVIVLAGDHGPFLSNRCAPLGLLDGVQEYRDRAGILTASAAEVEEIDYEEEADEDEELQPQVFILSSGEMTPFTIILMSPQSRLRHHLTASLLGSLSWEVEETF